MQDCNILQALQCMVATVVRMGMPGTGDVLFAKDIEDERLSRFSGWTKRLPIVWHVFCSRYEAKQKQTKGENDMWYALTSPGIVTAQLDMTEALAPLGIGLVGLLALSAVGIVWAAVQPSISRIMQSRPTPTLATESFTPDLPRTLPSIL